MLTRRSFITKSLVATAAATAIPAVLNSLTLACSGEKKLKKIGFISGIIGKELEGDWKSILRKTVEFGFSEIEIGDYLGESASTFLEYCKEIGLTPVAGGIDFNASDEDSLKRIDALKELGLKYAVVYWPWMTGGPFKLIDCKRSVDRLNSLGDLCYKNGLILCWHNHDKEFLPMDEGLPFDFLMNHTETSLVKCEMDIYWVKKGGADPLAILKQYPGRIKILHVKDMAPGITQDFACPGNGIIDFPSIFTEAYKQDIAHYFVECDQVPDGMACLQSSGVYLKNLRF
jgi:sugar phosphate isomerase/epimerase